MYLRDGKPFVFEAVQPVKLTPLDEWLDEMVISPAAIFAAADLATVYQR